MKFFEQIRAHIGGLIRIKHQLFWYDSRNWDGIRERFCILLNFTPAEDVRERGQKDSSGEPIYYFNESEMTVIVQSLAATDANKGKRDCMLQLLIDDKPQWVILNANSFEMVK